MTVGLPMWATASGVAAVTADADDVASTLATVGQCFPGGLDTLLLTSRRTSIGGASHGALRSGHTAFEEVGKQVALMKDFIAELTTFGSGFEALQNAPESNVSSAMAASWTRLSGMLDRMKKLEGYLMHAEQLEEALVGPRPDAKGMKARDSMESSVSARINTAVASGNELSAACDRASRLIGDSKSGGVAHQVSEMIEKLKNSRKKLREITVGEVEESVVPFWLQPPPDLVQETRCELPASAGRFGLACAAHKADAKSEGGRACCVSKRGSACRLASARIRCFL
eukprot:TRINITY_DN25940_c0_g1_i2.p1 TRINITY_DN25940_c0_g1~~TRINITY_DN25940_c0_g1_i2.p1  ORF type:complete len:285 (-),score=56.59 TRINITY_DN25940_c0_g1_i2:109-963(-)